MGSHQESDEVLQGEPTNEYPLSNSEEEELVLIVVGSDLLWDYCFNVASTDQIKTQVSTSKNPTGTNHQPNHYLNFSKP